MARIRAVATVVDFMIKEKERLGRERLVASTEEDGIGKQSLILYWAERMRSLYCFASLYARCNEQGGR